MEQIQLGYSLKDIPIPENKVYLEKVISSWEVSDKKMKWKVHRINNPARTANIGKGKTDPRIKFILPK